MTRSNMIVYLLVSVLIHAGMLLLLRLYRPAEMTAPEKTVQVEVAAIRELPMKSMEPTSSPPAAESFRFPPAAIAGTGLEAGEVMPPEFLSSPSSPTLDFHAGMDSVSPPERRSPETVSRRPAAVDGARIRKPDNVKQPAPFSQPSPPSVEFPYAMAAASMSKSHSPVTVPSAPVVDIGESAAPPSSVEPVEFESRITVEFERTDGDLKTASSERRIADPQPTAPAPLTYAWSFEPAGIDAPEMISESGAVLPETEIYMDSDIGASGERRAAPSHSPRQARPSGRQGPARAPADVTVASLSPRTPVILPQADDPVLVEPSVRPPEFYFPGTAGGAAFLLLVDTSGSVRGDPLEGIKRSAKAFVELMGQNDLAAVMTFDDKVSTSVGFTSEKALLHANIETLRTRGQKTLLFDGLAAAAANIRQEDRLSRHVVLFSDGKDEGSRAGRDEVLQALAASNVSVFAVGFTRVEKQYLDILRQLAERTGGIFVQTPEFQEMLALYKSTGPAPETRPEGDENIVYLMVTSDPSDARIVINGRFRGNTPLTLTIPAGKHEVLIDKDGFFAWEAQLNLEKGRQRISPSLVSKDHP